MAEAIFGIIAQKAAELAASQFIKESSRLSRVREDLDWIVSEMRYIQSYLKEVDVKQSRTNGVAKFISDIWDLAYDVEDIIDTYLPKMRLSRSRWKRHLDFSNMRIAHGFVKEVEGIKRRVHDITRALQTFGINASSLSRSGEEDTWDPRQSFPYPDEPSVVGFEIKIETLLHKVLDSGSHHHVVSIIGAAGLGKTTLARKVYHDDRLRQHFECIAWICVSERPNVKKLLQDIAGQVGLRKVNTEHNVEIDLFEFLSCNRYVIIIDDIWHTEAWDALRHGLPINSKYGSRIILTSRNRDVGVYIGGRDSVLELKPLDQETSRRLFNNIIVDDPQDPPQLKAISVDDPPDSRQLKIIIVDAPKDPPQLRTIGEQILERCGGVPLAIVLAAGLLKLRERSETAWKGVLEDMGQGNDQCTEIFALSYNDLPEKLRLCFLYFGLFPEDREIEAFDLINLWAAEGFIRGSSVREVEEVGDDYLNHLIARNVIQVDQRRYNGRVRSVRIHAIMHKLCIMVAKEINFFYIHGDEINFNNVLMARRVANHGSDTDHYPALYPKTSNLRAVFCFVSRYPWNTKANKNLLRDSKFLRVFSVEGSNDIPRSLLTEICNLRQLTYLKLGSPNITWMILELPHAISNLKSLLTLDVRECHRVCLPNVIWTMDQLRHILLPPNCHPLPSSQDNLDVFHPVEIYLPNLQTFHGLPGKLFKADWLHKLTSLRTLRVDSVNKDIIRLLSDVAPISHKLEELSLVGNVLHLPETTSLNFSRYDNLSELFIVSVKPNGLSHDKLPPNLTELTLIMTYLGTDPTDALKKLQKLKFLKLGQDSYLGKELVCSGGPGDFPELEVLEINQLSNLKMVVIEEGGVPRLSEFRIFRCSPETRVPDGVRDVMRTVE
ncbi:hypothetical protein RHMOL_Rhmol05G0212400 [Rhododendron molle]|uniref:Uncharacterized protein n=1 Tax=Rhododendron molle TaxID=49168 RepID=A0ACC0NTU0_RHOML|nr:hypothetical protein RHMOL_Rhmol05G0212400 [Rhododendron molle]